MAVRILETKTNFKQYMQTTNLAKPSVNPFPAFRELYEVCSKVHSVEFVCCYRILNANFLHKFQRLVYSEANVSSKDENVWSLLHLFETAFR